MKLNCFGFIHILKHFPKRTKRTLAKEVNKSVQNGSLTYCRPAVFHTSHLHEILDRVTSFPYMKYPQVIGVTLLLAVNEKKQRYSRIP